jgi:hypothetical protein
MSCPSVRAMFFRKKTSAGRAYLQIVENRREDGAARQQVIATLGRLEDLRQSGQLERLLRSGARFANKAIVVGTVADGERPRARRYGSDRLWCSKGCGKRRCYADTTVFTLLRPLSHETTSIA